MTTSNNASYCHLQGPKEYDDDDLAFLAKKKEEEKALKALKEKAGQKGTFGGAGLKKSGK